MRHHAADDNGNHHACNHEKHAQVGETGECLIGKQDGRTTDPGADEVAHKDMPLLYHKSGMDSRIHGNGLTSHDQRDGCRPNDPCQEIQPPREKAAHSAITAGCDCGPVIY